MKDLFVNTRAFLFVVLVSIFAGLSAISFAVSEPNDLRGISYSTSAEAVSSGGCSWFTALDRNSTDTHTTERLEVELDGCQITAYTVDTVEQGTQTPIYIDLEPDDLFIEWDEDPGDGSVGSFTYVGELEAVSDCGYARVSATNEDIINWTLYRAESSVSITITGTGLNEHDAIHVERQLISDFTKDDGLEGACVQPGDEITYMVCWDNLLDPNGNAPTFEDVYIVDELPDGVDYPAGFERFGPGDPNDPNSMFTIIPPDLGYDSNTHSYIWILGEILPLDSGCVTLDVVVNNEVAPGGNLHNVAEMWTGDIRIARATKDTLICCEWDGVDPNMIYVDHTANGSSNGLSWQDAHTDLQDALHHARTSYCISENGYTIYVAQGTYSPGPLDDDTFDLPDNVSMYGGFKTGGTDFAYRNPDKYETILDGMVDPNEIEQNDTIVTMGDDTLMDGFIVTQASFFGYGVYGDGVSFTIENCQIIENEADALFAANGDVFLKWCKINSNGKHGIEHSGLGHTINIGNSVINDNDWIGLYCRFSTPTIKNSVFAKNGFYQEGHYGINIFTPSDIPVLHNNTIAYNKKAGISFINNDPNSTVYPDVQNCILWYNNDNGGQIYGHDPDHLFYNCIYDANDIDGDDYTQNAGNNYNFTGNPRFAYRDPNQYDDPAIEFNPHLAFDSPLIGMGSPLLDYTDQNDIDAEIRLIGQYVDVGADEVYSCDGELSEEDLYNSYDINADGIVNLWEFNLLSAAWQTYEPNHPSFDPNAPPEVDEDDIFRYDARCDYDSDWHVGESDLELFSIEWLWTACWKQSQMNRFLSLPATLPMSSESMMMAPMQMSETSVFVTPEPTPTDQLLQAQDMIDFLNTIYKDELKGTVDKKTWNEFIDHLEGWVDSLAEDYLNTTE